MATDMAQLRREIEAAFASVPYPGDDGIVGHKCWECDEVLAKYKGKRWQDYKDRPLTLVGPPYRDACMLFTPQAFRYYAPLAMLASAESYQEADMLIDYFLGSLAPTDGKHAAKHEARLTAFTPAELRALLSFLAFMKERHPLDYATGPDNEEVVSLEKAITTRLGVTEMRGENAPPGAKE
ncbi:MAG: hypothetical protein HKL90_13805 [Elusimicrobia bacterium]|nr:hypothetical protein [Elusimicrobiota bacterium]